MPSYRTLEEVPYREGTVLTIGTFDGLHPGHRRIIDALLAERDRRGGRAIVLTFDPHPQQVLRKTGSGVPILTTSRQKIELLTAAGVDDVIVLPFTRDFAATPWQQFVDRLVAQTGLVHMVVGHDHAFGRDRAGNAESLAEYGAEKGFAVSQVPPLLFSDLPISSTRIRRALEAGAIEEATTLLGRPYALVGRIVEGDRRGRELGFPTANMRPEEPDQLIPPNAVYATRTRIYDPSGTEIVGTYGSMTNIGRRPSFTDGEVRTIETHLFDFSEEIYDRLISLEFRSLLRYEQSFASAEAFRTQLRVDEEAARRIVDSESASGA